MKRVFVVLRKGCFFFLGEVVFVARRVETTGRHLFWPGLGSGKASIRANAECSRCSRCSCTGRQDGNLPGSNDCYATPTGRWAAGSDVPCGSSGGLLGGARRPFPSDHPPSMRLPSAGALLCPLLVGSIADHGQLCCAVLCCAGPSPVLRGGAVGVASSGLFVLLQ